MNTAGGRMTLENPGRNHMLCEGRFLRIPLPALLSMLPMTLDTADTAVVSSTGLERRPFGNPLMIMRANVSFSSDWNARWTPARDSAADTSWNWHPNSRESASPSSVCTHLRAGRGWMSECERSERTNTATGSGIIKPTESRYLLTRREGDKWLRAPSANPE